MDKWKIPKYCIRINKKNLITKKRLHELKELVSEENYIFLYFLVYKFDINHVFMNFGIFSDVNYKCLVDCFEILLMRNFTIYAIKLLEYFNVRQNYYHLLDLCLLYGNLKVAKHILKLIPKFTPDSTHYGYNIPRCCSCNNKSKTNIIRWDVLNWMDKNLNYKGWTTTFIRYGLYHPDLFKWFNSKNYFEPINLIQSPHLIWIACLEMGRVDCLNFVEEQGYKITQTITNVIWENVNKYFIYKSGCYNVLLIPDNFIEILKWFIVRKMVLPPIVSSIICYTGDLDFCKWYKKMGCLFVSSGYAYATINGTIEILVWLYSQNIQIPENFQINGFTEQLLPYILKRSSIKCLEWYNSIGYFKGRLTFPLENYTFTINGSKHKLNIKSKHILQYIHNIIII